MYNAGASSANRRNDVWNINSFDEFRQNSVDKIIKYMKKEIHKIDRIKSKEKNKNRIQDLIKNFISSLRQIEFSNINKDDNSNQVERANTHIKESYEVNYFSKIKTEENAEFHEERYFSINDINPLFEVENQESIQFEEESCDKDYLEPVPNKLPPLTNFTSKTGSPKKIYTENVILSDSKIKAIQSHYSQI